MTVEEFLEEFKKAVEADIGEGILGRSDIEHLAAIFEELRTKAASDFLPR